jgi:hypothetical protein
MIAMGLTLGNPLVFNTIPFKEKGKFSRNPKGLCYKTFLFNRLSTLVNLLTLFVILYGLDIYLFGIMNLSHFQKY